MRIPPLSACLQCIRLDALYCACSVRTAFCCGVEGRPGGGGGGGGALAILVPAGCRQWLCEDCMLHRDVVGDLNQVDNRHNGVVGKAAVLKDNAKHCPVWAVVARHVVLAMTDGAALARKVYLSTNDFPFPFRS